MRTSDVVLTEDHLREVADYFLAKNAFAFDVEAQGDYRDVSHLCSLSWISLATEGMCVTIPFGHPNGDVIIGEKMVPEQYKSGKKKGTYRMIPGLAYDNPPAQLDPAVVFRILRPLFFRTDITKIGHDVVYDLSAVVKYFGEIPPGPYFDTKIGFWVLDESRIQLGLKDEIEHVYDFRYDFENIGACVEKYPFTLVAYYSYCDSKYAWLFYLRLLADLEKQNLRQIFDLEMNLMHAMVEMRLQGARVDTDRLKELQITLNEKIVLAEADVYKKAGKKFLISSNKQKQEILYGSKADGNQELKPWKLTKGGIRKQKLNQKITISDYSTDDLVLGSFPGNELCRAIQDYAEISKLKTAYVDSYLGTDEKPSLIYGDHIHAGFKQYGTVTGRFSCKAPNLQNIPRPYTELGELIRGAFIAEPGGKLVVADYSQIELVVLAHYIQSGALYEGFLKGIDPHTITAAMVTDQDPLDLAARIAAGDKNAKTARQDLGKAQPVDSLVLTPGGFVRMGDIKTGDLVNIPDGGCARVIKVFPQGLRPVYRITLSDGSQVECDEEHLWEVETRATTHVMTARELIDSGLRQPCGYFKYRVPQISPVSFSEQELPVHPYVVGALLGDGGFTQDFVTFTSADQDIVSRISGLLPEPLQLTFRKNSKYDYTITGHGNKGRYNPSVLRRFLNDSGLAGKNSHGKFIPAEYLTGSAEQRYELLRGLMDTDGYCPGKAALVSEYTSVSRQLAEDVVSLVRSLGGYASLSEKKTSWTHKSVKKTGTAYRVFLRTPECPFYLTRKADKWKKSPIRRRFITSAEYTGEKECQCILIDDPRHLYLTDDYVPTHNTLGFAVVYGAGLKKVASMAKISQPEAKRILKKHEQMFPEIHGFKDSVIRLARSRKPVPYVTTLLGRKRRVPLLNAHDDGIRMGAERQIFNSLIQGGAADILKLAMIRVDDMLPPEIKLSMTVHDEIVLSSPDEYVAEAERILSEAMTGEGIQKYLRVPLKIDIHSVSRWSEAK
jgi:DNA polymerase I-like protein with 3'-5' exonuclease and polymerase domains